MNAADSGNQLPLKAASRRLREIARGHLREIARRRSAITSAPESQATPRTEERRAAVNRTEKSIQVRLALEARIRRRVDTVIGRASSKTLEHLDGALSLFERRLDTEGQTHAR